MTRTLEPAATLARTWWIVLCANGEVLSATRGAPGGWVGAKLDGGTGVPRSLQEAARAVVAATRGDTAVATLQVDVPELDATVELVAVAAVGLRRARTDLRALFRHAVSALERQARALDVGLSITIDDDVPASLSLDPEKIAWVISALVGNAMRYVRRGTRNMPGGSIAVTVSCDAEWGELLLVVDDDGPGILAGVLENLFRRSPGAPHAAGPALTVVRDIVAAHGGSMDIDSSTDEDDHGTTVEVRIPIA